MDFKHKYIFDSRFKVFKILNMSDIYKYRVGSKWYSFDKSILEPEDLRVFNLADWKDKLKIITIYQELKPSDNDDVVILKTKTEKATKDKRASEYRAKRQKLEQELTKANKTNDEQGIAEQQRLVKELQQLDVEYADIVNIQSAETVNIAKANQVILKDVNELIKQTDKTLSELKTSLTSEDFKQLNKNFAEILTAQTKTQLEETIGAITNELEELSRKTLVPNVQRGVETMTEAMKNLKETVSSIQESETVVNLIDLGLLGDIDTKDRSYIKLVGDVLSRLKKVKISSDDLLMLSKYPRAAEVLKGYKNPIYRIKSLCEIIRLYVKWTELTENDSEVQKIVEQNTSSTKKTRYDITSEDNLKNFIDKLEISTDASQYNLIEKPTTKTIKQIGMYELNVRLNDQGTYEKIDYIVNGKKQEEQDKPGAVEPKAEGFLGLKTSKSAKKDYEQLMNEISNLKQQVEAMSAELRNLQDSSTKSEPTLRPLPETTYLSHSRPTDLSYLTDINQGKSQLKHIEPTEKAPELTELQQTLFKRRQDIEPDYEAEEEEEWGEGLKGQEGLTDPAAADCVGGLLGELQRDLEKYGLVLSLSPDKNAYFVKVFNRKQPKLRSAAKGNGVVEASKLVSSINQNTEYKDLKKLYESLY